MKFNVVKILRIVGAIVPVVARVVRSLGKNSDGGKRITDKERQEIIDAAGESICEIIDGQCK